MISKTFLHLLANRVLPTQNPPTPLNPQSVRTFSMKNAVDQSTAFLLWLQVSSPAPDN